MNKSSVAREKHFGQSEELRESKGGLNMHVLYGM